MVDVIGKLSHFLIIALALLTPVFFWNVTTEFFETPKFLILVVVTLGLLISWAVKSLLSSRVTVVKSPINLPLLLLLIVLLLSTVMSASFWVAIQGNFPRIHGGFVSYLFYILLYFGIILNLPKTDLVRKVVYTLIGSAVVLAVLGLLQYIGVNVWSLNFTAALNFSLAGSTFTANAILIMLLPVLIVSILHDSDQDILKQALKIEVAGRPTIEARTIIKVILATVVTVFGSTIFLTGTLTTYLGAVIALGLVFLVVPQKSAVKNSLYLLGPIAIIVILAVLSLVNIGGSKNILHNQYQNFPREVQLPIDTSWKIANRAFGDNPFWGTGPGTFLFDYSLYRPVDFNSSPYWDFRFDQAFNDYFQILATSGATGILSLLLLTAVFLSVAFKSLTKSGDNLESSLAVSGILFFVLLALHPSTLPVWVIGIIMMASFMVVSKHLSETSLGLVATSSSYSKSDRFVFPAALLSIVLAASIAALYFITRFMLADYYHRQAIQAVSENKPFEAYGRLVQATQLNKYNDLYRLDISKTSFAIANAVALSKGPTESSPAGSLTDKDKQEISNLLSLAIQEGGNATALSPSNPNNWETRASIYRQISGVAQNALDYSLAAYNEAIKRDPTNPLLRLAAGGIYYSVQNYDLAIRFFSDAVNLKPDYANGYYNLAIALKDKGDIQGAIAATERVLSLVKDPDSADYKTATGLLASLQEQSSPEVAGVKTAASEAEDSTLKTESDQSSALQGNKLPKVLDLPKDEIPSSTSSGSTKK